jgi:hypothetical protein
VEAYHILVAVNKLEYPDIADVPDIELQTRSAKAAALAFDTDHYRPGIVSYRRSA